MLFSRSAELIKTASGLLLIFEISRIWRLHKNLPATAMRNSIRKVTTLLFLFPPSCSFPPSSSSHSFFSSFYPSSPLSVMIWSCGQHLSPILPRLTSGGSTSVTAILLVVFLEIRRRIHVHPFLRSLMTPVHPRL